MDRSEIESAITRVYEPRLANDPASCIKCFTEEGVFRLAGTAEDGTAAPVAIGRDALLEAIQALVSVWRWIDQDVETVIIDGDRAVVRYNLTVEHLPSSETVVTEIVDHLHFDDRLLLLEMVEHVDTALVSRLAAKASGTYRTAEH